MFPVIALGIGVVSSSAFARQAAGETNMVDDAIAQAHAWTAVPRCVGDGMETSGTIIVCGRDRERDARRYRLPLPDERAGGPSGPVRGEAARASINDPLARGCGLFQGQRRCRKAESLLYGYGGGADPLTFMSRLGTRLLDPDADVVPPVTVPEATHGPE